MLELDVTVENQASISSMLSGLERQLPFALSVAINKTVNSAQSAIQDALPSEFHLRRADFIKRTIYRKPGQDFATKTNLVGAVRVNPERDVLAKFEDETVKRPIAAASLAVPIQRLNVPNLIIGRSDPRNVKRVMALIAEQGGKEVGPFKKRGAKRAVQQSFFLVHSRKGQTLILQRDAANVRVLYAFEKEVPIESHRLHFDEIAMKAALASWDKNVDEAIALAIATMR